MSRPQTARWSREPRIPTEPPRSAYRGLIFSLPVALLMWCALIVAVVWVLAGAR